MATNFSKRRSIKRHYGHSRQIRIGVFSAGCVRQEIVEREVFDGEKLGDLLAPLGLGWRERTKKELALMDDLVPMLKRLTDGHEISGLSAYEN